MCVRAHALKTHTLSYTYARAQWLSGHLSVFTPDGKEHFDLFDQECDSKLDYIIHVVTTIVNRDETDKNKEKPISSFKEYQTESSSGGLSGGGEGSGGGVGGGDGGKGRGGVEREGGEGGEEGVDGGEGGGGVGCVDEGNSLDLRRKEQARVSGWADGILKLEIEVRKSAGIQREWKSGMFDVCIYVLLHVCMYMQAYACVRICTYICMCICVCMCMCVYVCMCVCV